MGLLTNRDMDLNDRYALMSLDRLATQGCNTDRVEIHVYSNKNPLYDRLREGLANILMDYPRMQDLFMEVYRGRTLTRSKFKDRIVRFDGRFRNKHISVSEINAGGWPGHGSSWGTWGVYQPAPIRTSFFRVSLTRANDAVDMAYRIYDFLIDLGVVEEDAGYGPRRPANFTILIHHYFLPRNHDKNSCELHFSMDLLDKNYVSVSDGQSLATGKIVWSVKYPGE